MKKSVVARPPTTDRPQDSVARRAPRARHPHHFRRNLVGVVLILAAVSFLFFFRRTSSSSIAYGQFKDYNVMLVTIDTLRADHLPAYGYSKVKTPNLDRVAAQSFKFARAFAHVPLTLPSHASILTGRLPISHGVRDNGSFHLEDSENTLAEILRDKGYATAGFISAFVLDSTFNIQQGFDFYYDNFDVAEYQGVDPRSIQRRADETVTEAQNWVDQNSPKKFFMWIHFYDPHDPYDPPEPYRSEYSSEPYDGEIAFTDAAFGKLLAKLESKELMNRTILIVTADHGEGLGEHGESTHGMFLYNTTMHVPLFIRMPGGKSKTVEELVSHIDLVPTILDLVGIQIPAAVHGASIIPIIEGKEKKKRVAYSESFYSLFHYGWSALEGVTSKKYKYIQAPRPELFEVQKDWGEMKNIAQQNGPLARAMKSELDGIITVYAKKDLQSPRNMDLEMAEKLRSLGYIASRVSPTKRSEKIDPKDKIYLAVRLQEAAGAALAKNYPLAIRLIEPVLKEQGNIVEGLYVAGVSYAGVGNYDQAIHYLLQAISLTPDHAMAQYNLGAAYLMKNDLKQSEYWLLKVVEASPQLISAHIKLGQVYQTAKKPEQAAPHFQKAIAFYEKSLKQTTSKTSRAGLFASLAEIQFSAGDLGKAGESLREAVRLNPQKPSLHYNLAQVYEALDDNNSAIREYEEEIRVNPSDFRAFTNAGILYYEAKRLPDAVRCFQKSVELNQDDPRGYLQLAAVYRMMGKNEEASRLLEVLQERTSTQ
ncbi:sulfatase-like hydrolase/transferase [bacterium]|nr:sulfatase-like hydrolase/transferase [bacterium]